MATADSSFYIAPQPLETLPLNQPPNTSTMGITSRPLNPALFSNPPNRPRHEAFMREAFKMAEQALTIDETPVGCVFVHDGAIIGGGYNDTNRSLNGTRHAEFVAMEAILKQHPQSILRETDLYVTVEPCIMCAAALRQWQIRAVYFGCANERFGGCGGVLNIHTE